MNCLHRILRIPGKESPFPVFLHIAGMGNAAEKQAVAAGKTYIFKRDDNKPQTKEKEKK